MNQIQINIAKTDNEFIGITTSNNKMNITFPIGYNIHQETILAHEINKIKTIYQDVSKLLELLEISNEQSYQLDNIKFNFSSAIYLITDYLNNGLYQEHQLIKNKLNNGKINWSNTIKNKIPIYSTGNYIYVNTINESIKLENNDITEIQKYCLNKALTILSIFFNNIYIPSSKKFTNQQCIYKLQRKLATTNIDKDRQLISMMLKFLIGTSTDKMGDNEIKIGTNNFHTIWEKLLKKKITSIYPEKQYFPKSYYIINHEKNYTSSLRPDIIVESPNYIYLIDAKYYKITNLPQSTDIQKQLCYSYYLKNKTNKTIINIFLLPNQLDNNNFLYYGYATADNFIDENGGKIHTIYLDTKSLINNQTNILKDIINDKYQKNYQ